MSFHLNPLENRERHVISAGAEVLGGVLLTRAGIVVDVDENPDVYQSVLLGIDDRLDGQDPSTRNVLRAVQSEVTARLPRHNTYTSLLWEEANSRGLARLTPDDQIGLSRFVTAGVGICHQHALLNAAMLRLLQERGDIGGTISLESTEPNETDPDRHVRVAFSEAGEAFNLSTKFATRPNAMMVAMAMAV